MIPLLIMPLYFFLLFPGLNPGDEWKEEYALAILEARSINGTVAEAVIPGMKDAPFSICVVTDHYEFLVGHPVTPEGFNVLTKNDKHLNEAVLVRERVFSAGFLATFPAFDTIPVIIMGTPVNTKLSLSSWVLTMLHEHFHQLQMVHPGYFKSVNELNLSNGDQTGMWMLNYNFPYDDKKVDSLFEELSFELFDWIQNPHKKERIVWCFQELRKLISRDDWKYFQFQLWQEGTARYIEWRILEEMKNVYELNSNNSNIEDFALDSLKEFFFVHNMHELKDADLILKKRISFYSLGWAFGIWKTSKNKLWLDHYFSDMFELNIEQ